MELHPKFLETEGKEKSIVLPYEEFLKIQEALEDYEDLKALREAKGEKTYDLGQVKKELDL